ncbi:DUF4303 domain-containing protein [Pseudomarimonas arenosa]|uniref:DUF4303 domain-containing protein n=1 Tax=Pseudomarimonas arenosa TaxID=2774145 RepID=A0AAW3ZDI4_9GAMM|nr:DUF4303 domain-containing protein [Pseudomarimonas arenosa]
MASIRASVAAIRDKAPGQRLSAFAIFTDDGLVSLGWAANVSGYPEGDANNPIDAVDYPFGGYKEFSAPQAQLNASYNESAARGTFEEHVLGSFECIVEALASARSLGVIENDVLVFPCSTDPSELLESLERAAVERLNDSERVKQWNLAHE